MHYSRRFPLESDVCERKREHECLRERSEEEEVVAVQLIVVVVVRVG